MLVNYSRGGDLPPLMRNSLLQDSNAAAGFNSLRAERQQQVCQRCGRMSSGEQIDDFIRQTDCFISDDIIRSELTSGSSLCL
ncbi:MAG: hypothetical protein IKP95_09115 [Ruminococcus sp.]|nr:hypothetical protein [Ruminococcus sp.]